MIGTTRTIILGNEVGCLIEKVASSPEPDQRANERSSPDPDQRASTLFAPFWASTGRLEQSGGVGGP